MVHIGDMPITKKYLEKRGNSDKTEERICVSQRQLESTRNKNVEIIACRCIP